MFSWSQYFPCLLKVTRIMFIFYWFHDDVIWKRRLINKDMSYSEDTLHLNICYLFMNTLQLLKKLVLLKEKYFNWQIDFYNLNSIWKVYCQICIQYSDRILYYPSIKGKLISVKSLNFEFAWDYHKSIPRVYYMVVSSFKMHFLNDRLITLSRM